MNAPVPSTARRFEGQVAVVTGGGGGIGSAVAERLAAEGAHVVVCDVAEAAAAATFGSITGSGGAASVLAFDLTDPAACAGAVERVVAERGRVDVLVNNAGAWIASPIDDSADGGPDWAAGWQRNLTLNLTAPAYLCRSGIRHFRTAGGGIIVNVTSRSAHRGDDADHLAYGAAKGGLLALTKGIARGYAKDGVLAYAVAPGWVGTDLAAGELDPAMLARLPLREVTPPQDVAEVVVFLASGRSAAHHRRDHRHHRRGLRPLTGLLTSVDPGPHSARRLSYSMQVKSENAWTVVPRSTPSSSPSRSST